MQKSIKDILKNSPAVAKLRAGLTEDAPCRKDVCVRPKAEDGTLLAYNPKRLNHHANVYENGLGLNNTNNTGTIKSLSDPLRYIFNEADKGFVNDNDTIKLFDYYDFGTDFDKINEKRRRQGKEPIKMSLRNRVDNSFFHHPQRGYVSILKLTPEKRKQFDNEYNQYRHEKSH